MTGPLSAAQKLGIRLNELHAIIEQLRTSELDAVQKRHTANVEEWREFLKAAGAVEARKINARLIVERLTFEAEVAEAQVRHLIRSLREADKRVDVGRTFSADLRAEAKVIGLTPETMT